MPAPILDETEQRHLVETFCPRCEDVHAGAPKTCSRCGCVDLRTWTAPVATSFVMGPAALAEIPAA